MLLDKGANVNAQGGRYGTVANGFAFKGHTDLLRFIVDHNNVNLHLADTHGRTTLILAARGGHIETFKYLVSQGMDFTTSDAKGDNLISFASSGGSLAVLNLLLEQKPELASRQGRWSPLHWACKAGKAEVVELLIARGWKSERFTVAELQGDWTPLAIAVFHGHRGMVASLSEHCQAALGVGDISAYITGGTHGGAWCDGCFHDLYGPRFRCRTCLNFDYCFMCKSPLEHLHENHDWDRIEPPV
ncbi:ankyrin [Macroventuria anomochaeta]|uniref:Ankyrin n=1 Tax=Macroventuria anomochaeta TaxID=301207 RepID=A0ACB6RX46_9PLEO|nr:ankyrin [Macroventuria anomochaeta]KAF2626359.1 ankyrin [Macroventuria anomochaeta]